MRFGEIFRKLQKLGINCNLMKFADSGSNLVKFVEIRKHLELQFDEI